MFLLVVFVLISVGFAFSLLCACLLRCLVGWFLDCLVTWLVVSVGWMDVFVIYFAKQGVVGGYKVEISCKRHSIDMLVDLVEDQQNLGIFLSAAA